MKKLEKEPLNRHTTFKIGGSAEVLSIPENKEELIEEIKYCRNNNISYKILGNGSNILVKDEGVKGTVIKNKKALNYLEVEGNTVIAGSSVMLPKFVDFCVENNLEGMEYLYSIPGTIGGAVYMNAGRGRKYNLAISDRIEEVKVYDGEDIFVLKRDEIDFDYRWSIFHDHEDWIILEVKFKLEEQDIEIGKEKIEKRMKHVNKVQKRNNPNVGSIYKKSNGKILRLLRGIKFGGAKLEGNWISNVDNASSKDVLRLIKVVNFFHHILFRDFELEIEVW